MSEIIHDTPVKLQPLHRQSDDWLVKLVAILTALMGVVNLISATFPALMDRLKVIENIFPLEVRRGSHLTAALAGFALLMLAVNLRRRKRVAWLASLVLMIVSGVSHLIKGLDYEEALLAGTLVVILIVTRDHFHARSDTPSLKNGLLVLLAAVLFTLTYGVIGFYFLDRHFKVHYDIFAAIRQSFVMFTSFYDPGLEPLTGFGRYFADSIYLVAAGTIGYSLIMLARPVLMHQPASAAERAKAKEIVERHGRSTLARFTLFDDKTYYVSPGGTLFAFTPKGRVALVLGDPIGAESDLVASLEAFKSYCLHNDWMPAFYQVQPDYINIYKAAGFEVLTIGQEAIVDLNLFTLEGRAGKEFRNVSNRLERLGHRTELHLPPLAEALLLNLRDVSNEWLTMMRSSELRFSVGWFDDDYIRNSPVMAVHAPDGSITAFANLIPEYQRNEATEDLIRRRQQIENGTMDFLFIALFRWAKAQGFATYSLGLSALAGIGEHFDDPAAERALHYIYENLNHFYNFKGLHAFKDKFNPEWQPRYLIYPGLPSLPAVGAALVRANTGDNILWNLFRR